MVQQSPRDRGARVGLGALLGAVAGLVGLLPWLTTGGTAPLQNLWATATPPDGMPFVLLPFSQYHVTDIIGLVVVGSAAAGLIGRILRGRLSRAGMIALVGAALLVQLVALGQTTLEINAGLQAGTASAIYLATLVGVTALAVVVGLVAMLLVSLAPRAGAVVGLAVGALALGPWMTGPWIGGGELIPGAGGVLLAVARWLPPMLVGAAIAWAGLRSLGRVLAALVGLLLVWVVPALTTAIQASLGSRALLRDLPGLLDYFLRVLAAAATTPAVALPPLVVCVVVAGLGMLVHRGRRVG
ncbi:hypothetical protein FOJ82_12655 [Tessaracoccus rhinocerotis]|uniref:Uncharacterized protein n=1 Tax=Tessaracoccus rhinocerotis TaxID=1689449 RepID=A0A553JY62_9ACTN|nr:hypothetical protein [Tessaracoccus rhinocerotis]TRY17384.1 hypothetical protein FOJ82_12655 [Tessaracoccus rhinocerotis]